MRAVRDSIILCSSSPTRAKLLRDFGVEFEQSSPSFDEDSISTNIAREFVYRASLGKLESAKSSLGLDRTLLCADTVIATSSGEILRKARDIDDARMILLKQSGSSISIISSVHLYTPYKLFSDISATHYHFAPFDSDDLDRYLASGEWRGKAGACMVEGFCQKYIESVDGYQSTAMGLQVEVLLPWLGQIDV